MQTNKEKETTKGKVILATLILLMLLFLPNIAKSKEINIWPINYQNECINTIKKQEKKTEEKKLWIYFKASGRLDNRSINEIINGTYVFISIRNTKPTKKELGP